MNKIDAIMEEAEIQLYDNGDSGASDMSNLRAILEKHLQETTEERDVVEIKKNFIDELIEQCYPYDERNHNSVIGEDRLKEIRKSLD